MNEERGERGEEEEDVTKNGGGGGALDGEITAPVGIGDPAAEEGERIGPEGIERRNRRTGSLPKTKRT